MILDLKLQQQIVHLETIETCAELRGRVAPCECSPPNVLYTNWVSGERAGLTTPSKALVMCLLWKSHLLWINTPFTTSPEHLSWVRIAVLLCPTFLPTPTGLVFPSTQPESSSYSRSSWPSSTCLCLPYTPFSSLQNFSFSFIFLFYSFIFHLLCLFSLWSCNLLRP